MGGSIASLPIVADHQRARGSAAQQDVLGRMGGRNVQRAAQIGPLRVLPPRLADATLSR
jgi:hypothetical protein